MPTRYELIGTEDILSPGLLLFKELIESNLKRMLELAGGPGRLRPHVKTHKMRELVRRQLDAGITRHKCATIAEAEMLASCGVPDVLIAYPLVGPHQQRLARLVRNYPDCSFKVLADHEAPLRSLSAVLTAAELEVPVLLDIDAGQHRTGVPIGPQARSLYELIDQLPGFSPGGLHLYDGHNKQPAVAERRQAVQEQAGALMAFKRELEAGGLPVPELVVGSTPTFAIWAELPEVHCSPGTCLLHDHGYGSRFPDLGFELAALLLTRVISRPGRQLMCLDLGYKAVGADPPGQRLVLLDLPGARLVLQNEEHLLVESPEADRYQPGDALLACPTHICSTCALHQEAYVIERGRLVARWPVAARDRCIGV